MLKKRFGKKTKILLITVSFLAVILLGVLTGILLVYQRGITLIENLEDKTPGVMTTLYDENNSVFKEFAIEKRILLKSEDIPEVFKEALVASEDHSFYRHWGINIKGFLRAVMGKILGKRWGGGSSITQQLARRLFLTPEVTISRKLKEMLLAIQIEKRYSKDQIIAFYCNWIPFGGSAYGLEAASQYYFGKPTRELKLSEAAMIASIIPAPNNKFHVYRHPDQVLRRRNYVLGEMYRMGMINRPERDQAVREPLPIRSFDVNKDALADYFSEEIRKYLEEKYGQALLYKGGLNVHTTLNREIQNWAEYSLKEGLRALDKKRGWRLRSKRPNLIELKQDPQTSRLESWSRLRFTKDEIAEGIVLSVDAKQAKVRIGEYQGAMLARSADWTRYPLPKILKRGDITLFRILDADHRSLTLSLGLEQEPEVEGAILVVDNKTGAIKAMVGGYSFEKSKWNRAIQMVRQSGSTFKPIIYTAALEHGFTAATLMDDAPYSYIDPMTGIAWEPSNYEEDYLGPITLRTALAKSRNVVTARVIEAITPQIGVEYAKRFGIRSDLHPFMSIGLGAFEVTMKEMVEAFSVFANLGTRVNAYYVKSISDLNGYIIEKNQPELKQVIEKETAFVMNYLLRGVVQSGTGWRARSLKAPIGGKTGTTNDYKDAWFIGFTPTITVGVWVGYDKERSLGGGETGSEAASPIFVSFMEKYLGKFPETGTFRPPVGVLFIDIDKRTGKRLQPECLYPFKEAFIPGTEPGPLDFCNAEEHDKIFNYYGKEDKTTTEIQ